MSQKRVQIIIHGRVQGVFYRASAQREAKRLGITGWIKNRQDGTVEALVEGDETKVKEFLNWSQHGPTTARVEDIETRWRSYTGEFSAFKIVG